MATQSQAELAFEARVAFTRLLMAKVREDKYPSAAHLSLIEHTIPPQLVREYLDVLLAKVVNDNNPSITMLSRIQRIVTEMA